MKKIIFAVFIGIIVTFAASWLSSEKIKKDEAKKVEKAEKLEKASNEVHERFGKYLGNWVGQDDNAIHITVAKAKGHEDDFYTLTIAQKGTNTRVISLPIETNGVGVVMDAKKVEYHVEFTKFYEKDTKSLKPSIEIYTNSEGSENATEKNFFIRAFKQ